MPRVRLRNFAVSLDGFSAGPDQSIEHPLGTTGTEIFDWFFPTNTFRSMHQLETGETGIDDDIAREGMTGFGAWILGRNMFGPVRGPWPDESWKGWWGDEPPYHVPTFVLTHHARTPIPMKGGTEFRFVTDGIHSALEQARAAAGDLDVRIGGGVSTVRQFLQARLLDEVHLALRPIILGRGENLFAGLDLRALGYHVTRHVTGERATHVFIERTGG
ncbi:MAG: dihydrofolate reductase family protein [Gemmatimonadaceae bacterium]